MKIHIQIDRLILDGVPVNRDQRPVLQAAVEQEVARLVAEGGIAEGSGSKRVRSHGRAGTIRPARNAVPEEWGRQIGRAVYVGFNT